MSGSPQSPSTDRWLVVLLLLAAVGVPTAAGIAFAEQVTQRPWLALGLALLYEVLVLLVGFATKVWQKLESRWVDRVADWLDAAVLNLFSGYHRKYWQHLIYRHRDFDVKGLSTQGIYTLELEQVFVELSIAPQPSHQISADPIRQVPEELRQGSHTIWEYLNSEPMAEQNLVIIGAPGSGKTTLLKHMALTLSADKKHRQQVNAPDKLPVLLFLRDLAADISRGADQNGRDKPSTDVERDQLRQMLGVSLGEIELRDLCFRLEIDYENLPGETKADKARELIAYCERHGRLPELRAAYGDLFASPARQTNQLNRLSLPQAVQASLAKWDMSAPTGSRLV